MRGTGGNVKRAQDILFGMVFGVLCLVAALMIIQIRFKPLYSRLKASYCENPELLDLRELAPQGTTVSTILRLDADRDGLQEWIVAYRYDLVGYRSPISVVVYDAEGVDRELPVIYPYKLTTPDSDYLGEGAVQIGMVDVLNNLPEESGIRPELVITDVQNTTLSIYRVLDVNKVPNPPCVNLPNPYQVAGFFRATLRITRVGNAVTVYDRAGSERSQFALRRLYLPSSGSYFQPDTTVLLPPREASIEFAYGMPADILDTPYPEKLVLAFYNRLPGGDLASLLSAQAQQRLAGGQLDYGSPWPRATLQKALVQEISYVPGPSDTLSAFAQDTQPQAALVTTKVLFVGPDGQSQLRTIQWHLIKQGTQWKLHEASAE